MGYDVRGSLSSLIFGFSIINIWILIIGLILLVVIPFIWLMMILQESNVSNTELSFGIVKIGDQIVSNSWPIISAILLRGFDGITEVLKFKIGHKSKSFERCVMYVDYLGQSRYHDDLCSDMHSAPVIIGLYFGVLSLFTPDDIIELSNELVGLKENVVKFKPPFTLFLSDFNICFQSQQISYRWSIDQEAMSARKLTEIDECFGLSIDWDHEGYELSSKSELILTRKELSIGESAIIRSGYLMLYMLLIRILSSVTGNMFGSSKQSQIGNDPMENLKGDLNMRLI